LVLIFITSGQCMIVSTSKTFLDSCSDLRGCITQGFLEK
jgi:hypothetical protein